MHCIASPHQDGAPAKMVIVIKHLNLLERQEGCVDNNTLYSHIKHDTFQSHLNIDYLILTSEPSYYLHLTDGKEMETWTICRLPKVTKQTNSYPCFLLFRPRAGSFFGGGLCLLKLRAFSHQHFAWVPAFEVLQWGGRMFLLWLLMSVGNSS